MFKDTKQLYEVDEAFEWHKWSKEIPYIPMDADWTMQPIPPCNVGVVRFCIGHKRFPAVRVSVYLDCYDVAGIMHQPYWELHPNAEDNCDRFYMNEVEQLAAGIRAAVEYQLKAFAV